MSARSLKTEYEKEFNFDLRGRQTTTIQAPARPCDGGGPVLGEPITSLGREPVGRSAVDGREKFEVCKLQRARDGCLGARRR